MEYTAVTCPNCGAKLEIDEKLEKCICDYCESVVLTDDVLGEDDTKVVHKIRVEEVSPAYNRIKYGKVCLSAYDWDDAYRAFTDAILKEPQNYQAWHGCLAALTYNFTNINLGLANLHGVTGFASALKNVLLLGNRKQKRTVTSKISPMVNDMRENELSVYDTRFRTFKKAMKKKAIKKWVHIVLLVASLLLAIFAKRLMGGGTAFFIVFMLYPIFVLSKMKNKPTVMPKDEPHLNQKLLKDLDYIDRVITEFA
jgi:DNA-directed RNA polymerase subunit RPC12/RpoP